MTTLTQDTVANMSDVEKAKLQIDMITTYAFTKMPYGTGVLTFKHIKEMLSAEDVDLKDILDSARDTLVDADDYQCIRQIIAKCIADHNAKIHSD